MAIFHLDVKIISRSQGRSVVAAAAYRAGERLIDNRLGDTYDYGRKRGVGHSEIIAPRHAPEWAYDRSKLWNAVESVEKRKDSQLAREIMVALPIELSREENIELLRSFCYQEFVSKGMIADINIHEDNPDNPHAHILTTTREITTKGFGSKNREWNKRELVFDLRYQWQNKVNQFLEIAGQEARIDSRSLKDKGIDLEPAIHLGPAAHSANKEGRGENFAILTEHLEVLRRNGEKIIQDPTVALKKLTLQQSTFDEYAIAKLANQCSADLKQYQQVYSAIKNSNHLINIGKNEYDKDIYSTDTMIKLEHEMLNHAYELDLKKEHKVTVSAASKALQGKNLTPSQQKAFNHIINNGDLKIITGFAGTGKSFLMGVIKEAFENSGYNVSGACLSGIAAQELQNGSGIGSSTVDSRVFKWEKGIEKLSQKDILIIDEAAMLGSEKTLKLLSHANEAGAKVIIVHDKEQLSAIDAGAPSRALAERFGEVKLTHVVRQTNPEMSRATYEFGMGQPNRAIARYESLGAINCQAIDEKVARKLMIEAWASGRLEGKTQIMLAFKNDSVKALNEAARRVRISAGEIKRGNKFLVAKGQREFSKGDRIYFLKNDLDVKNGTLGTIESIKDETFKVKLDGKENRFVKFNLNDYKDIDHGYASTVHKAQGVTVDKSYILLSKHYDRHLTYVAFTRHKFNMMAFGSRQDFKDESAMYKTLCRDRSKSMAIDFAKARNIEPHNTFDLIVSSHASSEKELARERIEMRFLKEKFPEKKFSFAKPYEQLIGRIEGVVNLSDNRKMLCIQNRMHYKLIPIQHNLDREISKRVDMKLDKHAKIHTCLLGDGYDQKNKFKTIIENGKITNRENLFHDKSALFLKSGTIERSTELS